MGLVHWMGRSYYYHYWRLPHRCRILLHRDNLFRVKLSRYDNWVYFVWVWKMASSFVDVVVPPDDNHHYQIGASSPHHHRHYRDDNYLLSDATWTPREDIPDLVNGPVPTLEHPDVDVEASAAARDAATTFAGVETNGKEGRNDGDYSDDHHSHSMVLPEEMVHCYWNAVVDEEEEGVDDKDHDHSR